MLIGQRTRGTELSERELFGRAIENIVALRDCFRGMALKRGDERWLMPARQMEALEDQIKRLMTAKQVPFLILPRRG